jgi:hypothetical protein
MDVSSLGVTVVLLQDFDGDHQSVAYSSQTLHQQERKFSTYELKCLAVLFGLEKFRPYLEQTKFNLEMDNQALTWCISHPHQLGTIGH